MKRPKLIQIENYIRHKLPVKLRHDLEKFRITKEADAECCIYYHLRQTLPADGTWTILTRKFSRHTEHYVDLILVRKNWPRVAIEIKWNKKGMDEKDRHSLNTALKIMRVNKAYFISVGPLVDKYRKQDKNKFEKNRLHEIPVGLGATPSQIREWNRRRHLLGKNMRIGKAKTKLYIGTV
jgi:hypothetical protein